MISATVGREDLEHQLEVSARAWRDGRRVDGPGCLHFLAPAEPFCSNWLTRGSRRPSVEHSRTLADPIGRFHRTFAVVFTMVFGRGRPRTSSVRRRAVGMQISVQITH